MVKIKSLPLRSGEVVVEIIRPTQFHANFRIIFGLAIMLVDAFFTFWLIQKGLEGKIFYSVVMALGLYLVLYSAFFKKMNYLVVTNERIFDVQRESFMSETLSTLRLIDMADVVVVKKGVIPTILNYGLLTIHPKEGQYRFEIERVPKPGRVQNLLFEHRDRAARNNQYLDNSAMLKQVLKIIPDLSEAELTMLYERVNSRLEEIPDEISGVEEGVV